MEKKKSRSNTVASLKQRRRYSSLTFVARQAHLIRAKGNHILYFRAKNESEGIPVLLISVLISSTYHRQECGGGDGRLMCYMLVGTSA